MIFPDFCFHQRAPRHQAKPRARHFAKLTETEQLAERRSKMNIMLSTAGRRQGEAESFPVPVSQGARAGHYRRVRAHYSEKSAEQAKSCIPP